MVSADDQDDRAAGRAEEQPIGPATGCKTRDPLHADLLAPQPGCPPRSPPRQRAAPRPQGRAQRAQQGRAPPLRPARVRARQWQPTHLRPQWGPPARRRAPRAWGPQPWPAQQGAGQQTRMGHSCECNNVSIGRRAQAQLRLFNKVVQFLDGFDSGARATAQQGALNRCLLSLHMSCGAWHPPHPTPPGAGRPSPARGRRAWVRRRPLQRRARG